MYPSMAEHQYISKDASPCPGRHRQPLQYKASSRPSSSSLHSTRDSSPVLTSSDSQAQEHNLLQEDLQRLNFSDNDLESMFRSLDEVFRNAQEQETQIDVSELGVTDIHALLQRADLLSRRGRIDGDALIVIKSILDQMWWIESRHIVRAAKILADASRDANWRIPFGQSGILSFFLEVISADEVDSDLRLQSLRFVGNTCADTDQNRQRAVADGKILPIINQLRDSRLTETAIPVLYNICNDYEPAQEQARAGSLCSVLIEVLARDSLASKAVFNFICRLLDFSIDNYDVNLSPEYAVETLLRAASLPDLEVDDCVSLVDAAVSHLKTQRFQQHMVVNDLIDIPLSLIVRSHSSPASPSDLSSYSNIASKIRDPAEEGELFSMRRSLIQALSDISAIAEFSLRYADLDSRLITSLIKWLSAPRDQLQLCACIMLGNLARSDSTCASMISKFQLHLPLIAILQETSETQVLHSALGFLRNLGLPPSNKAILGESEIIETVARFWAPQIPPQLSYAATSLTRQIINGSPKNVQKLLISLSPDPESPAQSKTYLSLLLLLFERSDDMPTKIEVARIVAAIFRSLHTSNNFISQEVLDSVLHRLYELHPSLGRPLSMMVSQSQWPAIRSEGWFAMALMARSGEGSAAVAALLQQVEVFGPLEETIRGRSSLITNPPHEFPPNTNDDIERSGSDPRVEHETMMRVKDRENTMVLVNEILKNRSDEMDDIRLTVLEDLLHGREPSSKR